MHQLKYKIRSMILHKILLFLTYLTKLLNKPKTVTSEMTISPEKYSICKEMFKEWCPYVEKSQQENQSVPPAFPHPSILLVFPTHCFIHGSRSHEKKFFF